MVCSSCRKCCGALATTGRADPIAEGTKWFQWCKSMPCTSPKNARCSSSGQSACTMRTGWSRVKHRSMMSGSSDADRAPRSAVRLESSARKFPSTEGCPCGPWHSAATESPSQMRRNTPMVSSMKVG